MKNKKSKIDWEELFEGSSSTEEAMYYFLFGKYGINGFEEACEYLWVDEDGKHTDELGLEQEYKTAFKQMREMGVKAARQDCKNWMTATYGPDNYEERLSDYCTCDSCPLHGKDIE
jgi:hypothetical protein